MSTAFVLASCGRTSPSVAGPSGGTATLPPPSTPVATVLPTVLATVAPTPAPPSSERLTLRPLGTVQGAPLGYAEYLPPGYGDGSSRPLLVFLHGVGSNGDGTEPALRRVLDLGIPSLIQNDNWPANRSFIVVMPQHAPVAAERCWQAGDVDAFLRFAIGHYNVDESRVYLTGLSCGAIGAWDYLAAHGDEVVAAAVLVAGRATQAVTEAGCRLGRVPIWAFHGGADKVVPVAGITSPIKALNTCTDPAPVDLRLTIYPKAGHDSWTRTYDLSAGHDIYAWLLQHQRASSPTLSPAAP